MKTIKLTEKQLEILSTIQSEKALLEQEYQKVRKRESDVIIAISEAQGYSITTGSRIELKDGCIVISEPEKKQTSKKIKEALAKNNGVQ